jgi:surfactin synthase thioesterase subunit
MSSMTTMRCDRWVSPSAAPPDAAYRVLCFPYAGGGASVFRAWRALMAQDVAVCPVQLPGREWRMKERPCTDMSSLVRWAADDLEPLLDRRTVLFGHSLGALIAFELARETQRRGGDGPGLLMVSGCRAPQLPRGLPSARDLPAHEFWGYVSRLDGVPAAIAGNPELLEIALPILRADFTVFETYAYTPGDPLTCPIVALAGAEDSRVPLATVEPWRVHGSGFTLHVLAGGHFFLHTSVRAVVRIVADETSRVCGRRRIADHASRGQSWSS